MATETTAGWEQLRRAGTVRKSWQASS
jgi:hypothetical protein